MTKIDIISGFLGAGKTTLIKKLLSEAFAGEQVVLIENEFGEIGIDGGFLKESGIEIREMNSGCICCSLVGDFGKSLREVVDTYHPDRILIEPSGVGKLSDVIKAVQDVQSEIDAKLNSFTTVVDVTKCRIYRKNFGEFFSNQIEYAGYTGKWESELKNPYIFLIPDSPLKKMWYATLMEHVKAFADGCIICIPIGIFWHVPVIEIIYCILIYTVLQADRLYTMVIVQSLLGEVFGKTGQSLLRMFIQMALLGVGAGVGVLAAVLISQTLIFPIVLIYGLMITVAMGAIALLRFDTMEQFV